MRSTRDVVWQLHRALSTLIDDLDVTPDPPLLRARLRRACELVNLLARSLP